MKKANFQTAGMFAEGGLGRGAVSTLGGRPNLAPECAREAEGVPCLSALRPRPNSGRPHQDLPHAARVALEELEETFQVDRGPRPLSLQENLGASDVTAPAQSVRNHFGNLAFDRRAQRVRLLEGLGRLTLQQARVGVMRWALCLRSRITAGGFSVAIRCLRGYQELNVIQVITARAVHAPKSNRFIATA